MATLDDVRLWLKVSGVWHIVRAKGIPNYTLCGGIFWPAGTFESADRPQKRKCRDCMARLEKARVLTQEAEPNA